MPTGDVNKGTTYSGDDNDDLSSELISVKATSASVNKDVDTLIELRRCVMALKPILPFLVF